MLCAEVFSVSGGVDWNSLVLQCGFKRFLSSKEFSLPGAPAWLRARAQARCCMPGTLAGAAVGMGEELPMT